MIERAARLAAAMLSALAIAALFASGAQVHPSTAADGARSYLGFDRNIYPGDDAM
ncbi:MAG TPA: hypothetical protein VH114_09010 [Candidatus Acidoferrum sp.]|nr:hypothetical protein [Candidatus Acidoferrum sp.]